MKERKQAANWRQKSHVDPNFGLEMGRWKTNATKLTNDNRLDGNSKHRRSNHIQMKSKNIS